MPLGIIALKNAAVDAHGNGILGIVAKDAIAMRYFRGDLQSRGREKYHLAPFLSDATSCSRFVRSSVR